MFRVYLFFLIEYFLVQNVFTQNFDPNICPNGLTKGPNDVRWPKYFPNRFQITTEIATAVQTLEVTQIFHNPDQDFIRLHDVQLDSQVYLNFQTNEMLVINDQSKCDRFLIQPEESFTYVASEIVKPSILFGFNGRNNRQESFNVAFLGKDQIRGGIPVNKFQSCFYLQSENLTINATYYLVEHNRPTEIDLVQVDVRLNSNSYTLNIFHLSFDSSFQWTSENGLFCANRTSLKDLPANVPSAFSFFTETFSLPSDENKAKVESSTRRIDENLQIERNDFNVGKLPQTILPPPTVGLVDYAANISFLYTDATEQCTAMNISRSAMAPAEQMLFQFGNTDDLIGLHYTGIVDCSRNFLRCHRWIAQRDFVYFIQQYEWFWSAQFHQIDLDQSVPIQLIIQRIDKSGNKKPTKQEINIFNYEPSTNSFKTIDSTLGQCYRALGPNHNFNYAIVRFTLNNDGLFPVHQFITSLERRIHLQLANDLKVRHLRFSSFRVDTSRDVMDGDNRNVHVTFTVLDNPPSPSNRFNEDSLLTLIQKLSNQIDEGSFQVRDEYGGYQLQARPFSLQTLVLYLVPSEQNLIYRNQTYVVYQNVSETVTQRIQKTVSQTTGPKIAALWTGFALLGLLVALAIGAFIAIRRWAPVLHRQ